MRPRRFREAFAEEAGRELGRSVGALPIIALFAALYVGPYVVGAWCEHREEFKRERAAKDSAEIGSGSPA